jgi:hypothetical protein
MIIWQLIVKLLKLILASKITWLIAMKIEISTAKQQNNSIINMNIQNGKGLIELNETKQNKTKNILKKYKHNSILNLITFSFLFSVQLFKAKK